MVVTVVVGLVPVAVAPWGVSPVVVAVLVMLPVLMSFWVAMYVAVAVMGSPGRSVPVVPEGQVPYVRALRPGSGSVMVTPVRVMFPVLRAVRVYVMVSPTRMPVVVDGILVRVRVPRGARATVADASGLVAAAPDGGRALP